MLEFGNLPFTPGERLGGYNGFMVIRSTPLPTPRRAPSVPVQMLCSAAGGASLGVPAAILGHQLGERYGMSLVQSAVPHALKLLNHGWLSPATALNLAQQAFRPVVQAQVGALVLGGIGLTVGCMAGAYLAAGPASEG